MVLSICCFMFYTFSVANLRQVSDIERTFYFMPNYERKAKVLKSGLNTKVKSFDKEIYNLISNDFEKVQDIPFEEAMFCSSNNCDFDDLEEARRVNHNTYKRNDRLERRIQRYLKQGICIWLTLTFNEDTLAKTSEETRRRYVARYLKTQSNYYLANIDYGSTTEREHYHAIVRCNFVDMKSWPYGFAYTERIKNHCNSTVKLAKYVSKLCNHAIKETTKRACYIYSRC